MNNKILAELEFGSILSEATAQTTTGAELLKKYKSYLIANEASYGLVNNFVKEAYTYNYDNGVNEALSIVSDYINCNKTLWALATACESIYNNRASYNYINHNAAKQVESLLEMNEEDAVKYIKAGALKNVMFCESFRNIAKQIYKDVPMIEEAADYVCAHPVSMIENVGDGLLFEVNGVLYKMNDDKSIEESDWRVASNTFKIVSQLLESNYCAVDGHSITVTFGGYQYIIDESCVCKKCKDCMKEIMNTQNANSDDPEVKKAMTCKSETLNLDQLKEHNALVLKAVNPINKNSVARILESIALLCENYDNIVNLDNVSIYTTKNDKFIVIEAGTNIYSTLIQSNRHPKWTINENVIDALSFIKAKTNVTLSDKYKDVISECMDNINIQDKRDIENELNESKADSLKQRIAILIEKFKNDPVKLALLSKLASELSVE